MDDSERWFELFKAVLPAVYATCSTPENDLSEARIARAAATMADEALMVWEGEVRQREIESAADRDPPI